MDKTYLECTNFRDFAEQDRISALLLCDALNLNFDYFYNFDKQTGYVDRWATIDISYEGVYVNGAYCAIPVIDKYIDLEVFGNVLLDELCADCAQLLPNGKVVVMDCKG